VFRKVYRSWKIGIVVLIGALLIVFYGYFGGGFNKKGAIEVDKLSTRNPVEKVNEGKLVVDRFEGGYVVCISEDNTNIKLRRSMLPRGTIEGDVLISSEDGFKIDFEDRIKRKAEIDKLVKELWD